VATIDPTSELLHLNVGGPPPPAPVSELVLAVRPLVIVPTCAERIAASGDAIRHRGFSTYA
jgi:hypothetical protein